MRLPLAQLSSWRNKHSASKLCLLIWFLPPNAPPGHQRSGRGVFRNVMRKEFAGAANFLAVFFVQIEAIDGGYDRRRLWSTEATTDRRTKSRHFHFIPSRRYRRRCQNRLCLRRHRRLFSVGHHLAPADIFRLQIRNNITYKYELKKFKLKILCIHVCPVNIFEISRISSFMYLTVSQNVPILCRNWNKRSSKYLSRRA